MEILMFFLVYGIAWAAGYYTGVLNTKILWARAELSKKQIDAVKALKP